MMVVALPRTEMMVVTTEMMVAALPRTTFPKKILMKETFMQMQESPKQVQEVLIPKEERTSSC